jgi:hypothetical protein
MGNYGDLTPATIWQIACDAQDGIADREDVRRLLALFCECEEGKRSPPKELLLYLRTAFRAYLAGERGIEASLGLVKKKARPKADPRMRTAMALEVLKLRLHDSSHQNALDDVGKRYGYSTSIVGESWREYKTEAWCLLRIEQKIGAYPEVDKQIDRLEKILGKVSPRQAFLAEIAPEKSRTRSA